MRIHQWQGLLDASMGAELRGSKTADEPPFPKCRGWRKRACADSQTYRNLAHATAAEFRAAKLQPPLAHWARGACLQRRHSRLPLVQASMPMRARRPQAQPRAASATPSKRQDLIRLGGQVPMQIDGNSHSPKRLWRSGRIRCAALGSRSWTLAADTSGRTP